MIKKIYKKALAIVVIMTIAISPCLPNIVKTVKADDFASVLASFPSGYRKALQKLHDKYPKWKFVPYNTGITMATAVKNEYENNRSLIGNGSSVFLKSNASGHYNPKTGAYIAKDAGSWVVASKNAISYFMDPRNFLDEDHIYMFESLSYDAATQTEAGIESILQGSFMYKTNIGYLDTKGKYISTNTKYSTQILAAAKASKVSAYYLASRIIQEIGRSKNSKYAGMGGNSSVCGNYTKAYTGYYNFYNIGAYSSADPVANALKYAKASSGYDRPWNTPMKAITGGAKLIGETYISQGQNTGYYQRFNVNKASKYGLYNHQYMTNVYAAASEASITADAYQSQKIDSLAKTFIIPTYKSFTPKAMTVTLGAASKTGKTTSSVNLRKGAGTTYDTVTTLKKGQALTITTGKKTSVAFGSKWLLNPYWFHVTAKVGKKTYSGYLSATYIDWNLEREYSKGIPTYLPVVTNKTGKVYYRSTNPSIATVNASGQITGKANGTTTIFAIGANGAMAAMKVRIGSAGSLVAPTLKAKRKSYTSIKLTWKKVPNASGYRLYKKKKGKYKLLKTLSASKTSYVNKKLTTGTTYSYKIRAYKTVSGKKVFGPYSKVKKAKPYVSTPSFVLTKNKTTVSINLKAVSGASGYKIYRSDALNGKYTSIALLKKKTLSRKETLASKKTYFYKVRAYRTVKKKKKYGKYSSVKSITTD